MPIPLSNPPDIAELAARIEDARADIPGDEPVHLAAADFLEAVGAVGEAAPAELVTAAMAAGRPRRSAVRWVGWSGLGLAAAAALTAMLLLDRAPPPTAGTPATAQAIPLPSPPSQSQRPQTSPPAVAQRSRPVPTMVPAAAESTAPARHSPAGAKPKMAPEEPDVVPGHP